MKKSGEIRRPKLKTLHALIYTNFSFDFLGLDKVYFKNYFANKLV
jgi:hypothetical protein